MAQNWSIYVIILCKKSYSAMKKLNSPNLGPHTVSSGKAGELSYGCIGERISVNHVTWPGEQYRIPTLA